MKLLFVVNDAEFFISHRLPIALGALADGYKVHVATAAGPSVAAVRDHGLVHHEVPISRSGRNPIGEFRAIMALHALIGEVRPDIVHLVTIKPVLYGGVAARLRCVPGLVVAISGLGHVFGDAPRQKLLRLLLGPLYRFALGHRNLRIIFQNEQDRRALTRIARLREKTIVMITGSGVDLDLYVKREEPSDIPVVTFASRLLVSKGVREFVAMARRLRATGVAARFWLVGRVDPGNPMTIAEEELLVWQQEGVVEVLGHRSDIPDLFARSNIVAFPSYYREGLPKVLLEAAACGRAVVTTDHPGCRDAIAPGETGIIVPPRDVESLSAAVRTLVENDEMRRAMGRAGRNLAERKFAVDKVVATHLEIYRALRAAGDGSLQ